jgi:endonuclease/exonuclease/phosphatase family metal-dependent hydrolase
MPKGHQTLAIKKVKALKFAKRHKLALLVVFFVIILAGFIASQTVETIAVETVEEIFDEKITIFSFNIQIFGVSKMSKPEVVSILVDIISRADITAIQEVRSAGIAPVEQFMALLPEKYGYVIGPKAGRSSSTEQYWVIYDTSKLAVNGTDSWPDYNDVFERNPYAVYFTAKGGFDFVLIDNHLKPLDAAAEIEALPEVAAYYQSFWNESDVLIVGDFNADGFYYDESRLVSVFPPPAYTIILTNEYDTTVAASDNTYDRFIITASASEDFTGNFGVLRFDEVYDFDTYNIKPREVSDHYPIWAEFATNRDTD